MNIRSNQDTTLPPVTTGPLPSSRKIFVTPDEAPDVRVPLREIILSEGAGEPNLSVYDTSGPYTDPTVTIDVNAGLSRNRTAWVKERGRVEEYEGRTVKPRGASGGWIARRRRLRTAKVLARRCPPSSRRNSCALKSRAAAPSSPATSTTANSSR